MPTGYTAIIDDNLDVSFEAFALRCSRAFGALVMLRDNPLDEPLPTELQPAPYYADRVAKARAELAAADALTEEQAGAMMAEEATARERRNLKYREEHAAKRAGYDRMAEAARNWKPPTPDHKGLRDFMLEQLRTGDPGECYQEPAATTTASTWLTERRAAAAKNLSYALTNLAEEEERTRKRNEWLQALRESLAAAK